MKVCCIKRNVWKGPNGLTVTKPKYGDTLIVEEVLNDPDGRYYVFEGRPHVAFNASFFVPVVRDNRKEGITFVEEEELVS